MNSPIAADATYQPHSPRCADRQCPRCYAWIGGECFVVELANLVTRFETNENGHRLETPSHVAVRLGRKPVS